VILAAPQQIYFAQYSSVWGSNMPRVFGSISEDLLHKFDTDCAEKGVNRSQALSIAIEHYLNNGSMDDRTERDDLSATFDNLRTALDRRSQEILHLNALLDAQRSEILHLRELSTSLTAKIIPALPIIQDTPQPKKPRWKFW
jgi:hypothetical protein